MKVGDLVYYAPSLPYRRIMGIVTGTHMTADAYGHKLRLWHIQWIDGCHQTHEQEQYLESANVD